MNDEGNFNGKLKRETGIPFSRSSRDSSNNRLPDWNRIYNEMKVDDMPWYYPELDPDLKEALQELSILSGSFLDLGTGPGTQAIELSKMGFEVTGTDISADAIHNASQLTERVKFRQDDILNSHIEIKFDYIFDRGCFHIIHENNRPDYILQIVRLLNKDGIFFLKCFSDKNPLTGYGPYHFSATMIESLFAYRFDILQLKESVYQSISVQNNKTLFVVMKIKE